MCQLLCTETNFAAVHAALLAMQAVNRHLGNKCVRPRVHTARVCVKTHSVRL